MPFPSEIYSHWQIKMVKEGVQEIRFTEKALNRF
jgi:hypothetical protein